MVGATGLEPAYSRFQAESPTFGTTLRYISGLSELRLPTARDKMVADEALESSWYGL